MCIHPNILYYIHYYLQGHCTQQIADGTYYEGELNNDVRHEYEGVTNPDGQTHKEDVSAESVSRDVYEREQAGRAVRTVLASTKHNNNKDANTTNTNTSHNINGASDGPGKRLTSSGILMEGTFCGGQLHGVGKVTYPDGSVYEGNWEKGVKCGYGKKTLATGEICEGEWRDGAIYNGSGVKISRAGFVIEGTWVEGKQQGVGKKTSPRTGYSYVGDFLDDQYHGQGKVVYADKRQYEGAWVHGKEHGVGKRTLPCGLVVQGEFRNGEYVE